MKWEALKVCIARKVIHMFEHWSCCEAHMSDVTIVFGGSRDNRRTIRLVSSPLREEAPCYVVGLFRKKSPRKQTSIESHQVLDTHRRRGWWYKLGIEQADDLHITHTTLYSSSNIVQERPLELGASFYMKHWTLANTATCNEDHRLGS